MAVDRIEYASMFGDVGDQIKSDGVTTLTESAIYNKLKSIDPETVKDWNEVYDMAKEVAMGDGKIDEDEKIILGIIESYGIKSEEKSRTCCGCQPGPGPYSGNQ